MTVDKYWRRQEGLGRRRRAQEGLDQQREWEGIGQHRRVLATLATRNI
jgi:hypothetical protein